MRFACAGAADVLRTPPGKGRALRVAGLLQTVVHKHQAHKLWLGYCHMVEGARVRCEAVSLGEGPPCCRGLSGFVPGSTVCEQDCYV